MLYFLSLWLGVSFTYYTVYKLNFTLFIQCFMVYFLFLLLKVVSDLENTCQVAGTEGEIASLQNLS